MCVYACVVCVCVCVCVCMRVLCVCVCMCMCVYSDMCACVTYGKITESCIHNKLRSFAAIYYFLLRPCESAWCRAAPCAEVWRALALWCLR